MDRPMPSDASTYTTGNAIPTLAEIQEKIKKPWIAKKDNVDGLPSEEEVCRMIPYRVFTEMRMGRQDVEDEWDDAKEIYEAVIPREDPFRKNLRPNIKIPWSMAITESALAEEIDAFPGFELDTQEEDDKIKIPILEACLKYTLDRTNWEKVKMRALRLRRIFGVSIIRVSYVRTNRWIWQRVPFKNDDGLLDIMYKKVMDHEWDDIRYDVVDDLNRFYMDESALDISEADDCALVTELTWSQFRNTYQHDNRYYNVDQVYPGAYYNVDYNTGQWVYPEVDQLDLSKKVRVTEYWDKQNDLYITLANNIPIRICHLVDDHKQLPFAMLHMYRRPHSAWSKGLPKLIESIEAAYNAIIGAELQATKLAFPVITTEEDSGIDPKAKASYPGVVFEGAMNKMKLEKLGSVPAEAYRLKEKLEELLIWITRINYQNVYGTGSDRVGIEALKKESMISGITLNLKENEADFVVRLGNLTLQEILQHFKTPKVRALVNDEEAKTLENETLKKTGRELIYDTVQVTNRKTGYTTKEKKAVGVMEYRKLNVNFKLEPTKEKGIFNLSFLGNGETSQILALPEYIRCKFRMEVRAVRPSAMGSSKEARKLMLMEFSNHVRQVNKDLKELGAPQIYDVFEVEKQVVDSQEMTKKVLQKQNIDPKANAVSRMEKIAAPFVNTSTSVPTRMGPPITGDLSAPPADANALTPEQQQQFASLSQ